MNNDNSKALRSALASAIKYHVDANNLTGVAAAKLAGHASPSRMCKILAGEVDKVSSDALADILGSFGYQVYSVIGSNDGHEVAFKAVCHD